MSLFESTGDALKSHTHLASLLTTSSDDGVYSIRNIIQGTHRFPSLLLYIDWSRKGFIYFITLRLMDLFSLFVLFSHFRPRDILMGVFLLLFHKLCVHLHVHKTKFERNYSLE